jgi:hypothetical protein
MVRYLKLYSLSIKLNIFYFEINSDGCNESGRKGLVRVTEKKTSFADTFCDTKWILVLTEHAE